MYPISIGSQSSFTYNTITTPSPPNGTNWAANQNNSGGLNNGNGIGNGDNNSVNTNDVSASDYDSDD